jgi:hypothetical protein
MYITRKLLVRARLKSGTFAFRAYLDTATAGARAVPARSGVEDESLYE